MEGPEDNRVSRTSGGNRRERGISGADPDWDLRRGLGVFPSTSPESYLDDIDLTVFKRTRYNHCREGGREGGRTSELKKMERHHQL